MLVAVAVAAAVVVVVVRLVRVAAGKVVQHHQQGHVAVEGGYSKAGVPEWAAQAQAGGVKARTPDSFRSKSGGHGVFERSNTPCGD
jgi:hypothetical protein